jgi:hypothetical protein
MEISLSNSLMTRRGPKGARDGIRLPTPYLAPSAHPSDPSLHPLPPIRPKNVAMIAAMVLSGETPMQTANRGRHCNTPVFR